MRKLEDFFNLLPQGYKWAVEFRNLSWLAEETWHLLRKHNVTDTLVDEPLLPPDVVITAPHTCIRWHGHGKTPWYNYRYSEEKLKSWTEKIQQMEAKPLEVFGYFNNHYRAYAVENCVDMLRL